MKRLIASVATAIACSGLWVSAVAQDYSPYPGVTITGVTITGGPGYPADDASASADGSTAPAQWTPDQLDQMVAPLALYPDPLVAEIMAAATAPNDIVLADRYLGQGFTADDLAQQNLDPSVLALAHYPDLLKWLDDNLTWTTQLGQAFTTQQADVMNAVQRMRAKAQSLGNLPSTPQENVVQDDGDIEIEPASPDMVYVPEYDPSVIYVTPGIYCMFGVGLPAGYWWPYDWNWFNHSVIYWDRRHPRPHDWWTRPPGGRHAGGFAHVWHPSGHSGIIITGGDRGYASRPGPRMNVNRPQTFHANPAHEAPTAPARPGVTILNGPNRTAPAVRPPTRAIEPNSGAVVPNSRAVVPRVGSVVPSVGSPAPAIGSVAPRSSRVVVEPPNYGESSFGRAPGAGEGMFGGIESPRATEASSARGAESRGVSSPVGGGYSAPAAHASGGGGGAPGGFSGGGGGGGASHGGGSSGGSSSGSGGNRR